jgi:O-antigen/teichoic acid export membrane protein
MASGIRQLASQTAIYGLSSMVGRFINFLLVPLYTARLAEISDYGVVNVMFSYAAFLAVLYTYGMETAFFSFAREEGKEQSAYATAFRAILISTLLFTLPALLFAESIASLIGYPGNAFYIRCFAGILAADALAALPFAWLRQKQQALRFAGIRLTGIFVNVGLNLFFLIGLPQLVALGWINPSFAQTDHLVTYIFLSNLLASLCTFLLLWPQWKQAFGGYDRALLTRMLHYALPLVWVGLAGMVNETLDRILLKSLLPVQEGDTQVGIYGAFYKLAMVLTIFVQAFRFAAEPFFFSRSKDDRPQETYARVMAVFIWVVSGMALATLLLLDVLAPLLIRREMYFDDPRGLAIVPILLAANLCLGIYYNLSIWYKLTGQTRMGARIALAGALLTIVLNLLFIPNWGFVASAWTTFAVYLLMMLASYVLGQKYYPVAYRKGSALLAVGSAVAIYLMWNYWNISRSEEPVLWTVALVAMGGAYLLLMFKTELWNKKPN